MPTPIRLTRRPLWIVFALLFGLSGCGGGGGDSDPPPAEQPPPAEEPPPGEDPPPGEEPEEPPYGLSQRASLTDFALPLGGAGLGTYELVRRFPGLSFSSAIYVSGIPGDDRLALVEQSGLVHVFEADPAVTTTRTILDLSSEVLFQGEQGLLGLAFDPDFVDNRFLYVHYTLPSPRRSQIARFTWDTATDRVDPASRKELLTLEQPYRNHNGGMLAFGPDRYLYVAFGDGGSGGDPGNRAQDLSNWFGSLLRIDVHPADPADRYDIPPDNPYVDELTAQPEIWAHGLRNPFRFSFDRATGTLWLGDVGQGNEEEIDLITRGGNYGWRVYEGNRQFDPSENDLPRSAFTFPIHTYQNAGGAAVIGGYVYRGDAAPSLRGRYLYADYVTGEVRALAYDGNAVTADDLIATTASPTSFGEDERGEVYLVTQGSGLFGFEETSGGGEPGPDRLSDTGLFTDLAALAAAPGLIEYEVNQPFWSDGATKRRWLGIPDGRAIGFSDTGAWSFPIGTVIVKHFELELIEGDPNSRRRLESRVLTRTANGWRGFTYRWSDAQDDAVLVADGDAETFTIETDDGPRQQLYEYPSSADCLRCHTEAAGFVLGVRTRQLNRDFLYAETNVQDNQLRALNHVALFDADIGSVARFERYPDVADSGQPLDLRARTWLDVNCAHCHRPGGPAPGELDLRFDTPAASMNAIDIAPTEGNLGITDARIVAPGDRARSVLWRRISELGAAHMPPLSTHVVDETGVQVVGDWIDGL